MEDPTTKIIEEETSEMRQITDALSKNLTRALQLLHKSVKIEQLIGDQDEFLGYMYDVARATIVFLHSSFETALRSIVGIKLKEGATSPLFSSQVERTNCRRVNCQNTVVEALMISWARQSMNTLITSVLIMPMILHLLSLG